MSSNGWELKSSNLTPAGFKVETSIFNFTFLQIMQQQIGKETVSARVNTCPHGTRVKP